MTDIDNKPQEQDTPASMEPWPFVTTPSTGAVSCGKITISSPMAMSASAISSIRGGHTLR